MDERYPGPGSLSWRLLGQKRMVLVAGRALVLEAAMPAGGAALARHSTYRTRPWRRLQLTLESLQRLTYGDEDTRARECARVRRAHKHIHGTDDSGRPYDGMDDWSRTWIMVTLYDAMVTMERLGGAPLSLDEEAELWAEWRTLILAFGVADEIVPPDLAAYRARFDDVIATGLEDNPEVRHLLGAVYASAPPPPALHRCPRRLWRLLSSLAGAAMASVLRADLPQSFRRQLGLRHRRRDAALSLVLHRAARLVMTALPVGQRYLPPARSAIVDGSLAAPVSRRRVPAPRRGQDAAYGLRERLGRFFDRVMDQTGDGVITREDLQAMARSVCWPLELDADGERRVYAAFDVWWQAIAAGAGASVERDAFVTAAAKAADTPGSALHAAMLGAMGAAFDAADADGSGHIDMAEYRTLFGPRLHPADVSEGFRELDIDGDGSITRQEFLEALTRYFTAASDLRAGALLFGGV